MVLLSSQTPVSFRVILWNVEREHLCFRLIKFLLELSLESRSTGTYDPDNNVHGPNLSGLPIPHPRRDLRVEYGPRGKETVWY